MKIKYTNPLKISISLFVAVLLFTFLDFIIHSLSPNFAVPSYYFRNKIIFATIYTGVIYYFVRKMQAWKQALIIAGVVSLLLQIRYFYEGYNLQFVIEFLFIHFGILFLVLLLALKIRKKYLEKKTKV